MHYCEIHPILKLVSDKGDSYTYFQRSIEKNNVVLLIADSDVNTWRSYAEALSHSNSPYFSRGNASTQLPVVKLHSPKAHHVSSSYKTGAAVSFTAMAAAAL